MGGSKTKAKGREALAPKNGEGKWSTQETACRVYETTFFFGT